MYPSTTDLQTLSKHKKHTASEMPQARQRTLLNEATGKAKTSQPTDSCATPDPITRRKTKQGLSPSTAKYPTPLPVCCKDTSGTKILNSRAFNKVLNQHCGFEHSNPMLTFQLMDHQIKCGCKISSSEDTVETTIF